MHTNLNFFIGTEAELIKMFPVMMKLQEKQTPYRIIASGQNDIKASPVLSTLNGGHVDLELSEESSIQKTAAGLLRWYFQTSRQQVKAFRAAFRGDDMARSIMVVHGDTVSTMMGATLGKKLGMHVAHVEAGLRSHNWLNPFPEEIDRVVTSWKADMHFAPGQVPCMNLKRAKGAVVDTVYNTIADSLAYSRTIPCKDAHITALQHSTYFVFVLHRQENLARKAFLEALVKRVIRQSENFPCVFILHKPTEIALRENGLLDLILKCKNITVLPRVNYFDFMKLLEGAQFVLTDGGSNQEELSYMGKPCLILRTHTERQDGIGENVVLYDGDLNKMDAFLRTYPEHRREPIVPLFSPAELIADTLRQKIQEG